VCELHGDGKWQHDECRATPCDGAHGVIEVILFFIFASDLTPTTLRVFEVKAYVRERKERGGKKKPL